MKESLTHTRIWVYLTERSDINDTTTKHSQHGNNIFPAWEHFIPNLGIISFFHDFGFTELTLHSFFRNFGCAEHTMHSAMKRKSRICFVLLSTFRNFAAAYEKRVSICACGGIGRRARLRIWCLTTCRFESCQAHKVSKE